MISGPVVKESENAIDRSATGAPRRVCRMKRAAAVLLAALLAPAPAAADVPAVGPQPAGEASRVYESIAITQPFADQTIFDNNGDVEVAIAITPALRGGDRIVLDVDGRAMSPRRRPHFELTGIDRGEHTLRAHAVDARGGLLIASAPVTFYLWRASRLFPNRSGK